MKHEPTIAVVDDDESIRHTTRDFLESAGYFVTTFDSAESLLGAGDLGHLACVITDVRMPGMNGLELHGRLRELGWAMPTILITAYADERLRAQAATARVTCCLAKPFAAEELLECLRTALRPAAPGRTDLFHPSTRKEDSQ